MTLPQLRTRRMAMRTFQDQIDQVNEIKLRSMGKNLPRACDAIRLAEAWPRLVVSKKEVPLYTGFTVLQQQLESMIIWNQGPAVAGIEQGEPLYYTWALALWWYEMGSLAAKTRCPLSVYDVIPAFWYSDNTQYAQNGVDLSPYEVLLHRYAEMGKKYAQEMVRLAATWESDGVALNEIAQFSENKVIVPEFMEWVQLNQQQEHPNPNMFFDKWELAHWFYAVLARIPLIQCGAWREENAGADSEQWLDEWEVIVWRDEMVRTVPPPVGSLPLAWLQ